MERYPGLAEYHCSCDGSIKLNILWDIVIEDIPALKQFCDEQLSAAEHSEEP